MRAKILMLAKTVKTKDSCQYDFKMARKNDKNSYKYIFFTEYVERTTTDSVIRTSIENSNKAS